MEFEIHSLSGTKTEQYEGLMEQVKALFSAETDALAKLSNLLALLHHQFQWFWTGIYLVRQNQLVLGPFQGPVACTRIDKGRGVSGTAWQQAASLIVADVHQFPGHIACNSASRSEIVIPILQNDQVVAVLDVDSKELAHFDQTDQYYLEQIAALIHFPLTV